MSCRLIALSALVAFAHAQGVILSAVGDAGKSLPLQIDLTANDANVINADEITKNAVNECGRTLLGGNIDIGENTEKQLGAKTVTSVTKGSKVAVTIAQGNADGAGPYFCDLDLSSNGDGTAGQTVLNVDEKDNGDGTSALSVTMPADLACFGASTGNVCTVRCRNNATAGPFGGCFAVQQTDVTASKNLPGTIATAQTAKGIDAQVQVNVADLSAGIKAIEGAGPSEAEQGLAMVDEILNIDSTAAATVAIAAASSTAASSQATSAAGNTGNNNNNGGNTGNTGNNGGNNGGNANAGKGKGFGGFGGGFGGKGKGFGAFGGQGKFNKRSMRWGKRN